MSRERQERGRWFSAEPVFKKLLSGLFISLSGLCHEKVSLSHEKIMSKMPAQHHNENLNKWINQGKINFWEEKSSHILDMYSSTNLEPFFVIGDVGVF